ncbi:MAG: PDGLE domain-containing protein [Firmicutes bacterium]|nr:PDGLE domain-containing protein [Bacillota bacterium]
MNRKVLTALLVALAVALFLAPFASSNPDGLERVAEDKGFLERSEGREVVAAPIPDYLLPGIANEKLATAAAGFIGTLATFGVAYGVGRLVAGRKARDRQAEP